MIDSTNPRILADQIRALWNKVKSITGLPATTSATAGQILKLDSNKEATWADEYSYTPPAYSETEVNTGQKWLDGKDIYCKTFTGNFNGEALTVDSEIVADKIINVDGILNNGNSYYHNGFTTSSNTRFMISYNNLLNTFTIQAASTFTSAIYYITIYYTKPAPTPDPENREPEPDPEPETKKTTRKKSS